MLKLGVNGMNLELQNLYQQLYEAVGNQLYYLEAIDVGKFDSSALMLRQADKKVKEIHKKIKEKLDAEARQK